MGGEKAMDGAEIIEKVAEMLGGAKCGVFGCHWKVVVNEEDRSLYAYECPDCGDRDPKEGWLNSVMPFPIQDA